jgi:teichuronic acid biosynthesis glycosyltransferase TuaG
MVINNLPIVSVVIPMYNSSNTIRATIESVLTQTFHDFEIIIIDDCSNDDSFNIVSEILKEDTRISLIKTKNNSGGPAEPRNIGIQHARGEFIAFLDSDDLWLPEKLELQLDSFSENISLVCSDMFLLVGNSLKYSYFKLYIRKFVFRLPYYGLLLTNQICLSSVLCRAKLLHNISFNQDPKIHTVEDYLLWLELILSRNVSLFFINKPLVKYRIHSTNITANKYLQYIRANYCLNYFILDNHSYSNNSLYYLGIIYRTVSIFISKLFNGK